MKKLKKKVSKRAIVRRLTYSFTTKKGSSSDILGLGLWINSCERPTRIDRLFVSESQTSLSLHHRTNPQNTLRTREAMSRQLQQLQQLFRRLHVAVFRLFAPTERQTSGAPFKTLPPLSALLFPFLPLDIAARITMWQRRRGE